jgi:hypothetical protein
MKATFLLFVVFSFQLANAQIVTTDARYNALVREFSILLSGYYRLSQAVGEMCLTGRNIPIPASAIAQFNPNTLNNQARSLHSRLGDYVTSSNANNRYLRNAASNREKIVLAIAYETGFARQNSMLCSDWIEATDSDKIFLYFELIEVWEELYALSLKK